MVLMLPWFLAAVLAAPLPPVATPQPDRDGWKVWHTRHFRIESDTPLPHPKVVRLAQVADGTLEAVKAHPLPLFAPPSDKRPLVSVFGGETAYVAAGGIRGSAGLYVARRASVLLLADYVAPDDATARRFPPGHDEDIVVHELVHLAMHRVNSRLPQWFIEGVAEYFACAHQGGGRFRFETVDAFVAAHLRERFRTKDSKIPLAKVSDLVGLRPRSWFDALEKLPPDERYRAYATSLLLAHYHLNGGEERETLIREALQQPLRRPHPLLNAAQGPEIEEKLIRYWRSKGLFLWFETRLEPSGNGAKGR